MEQEFCAKNLVHSELKVAESEDGDNGCLRSVKGKIFAIEGDPGNMDKFDF